MMINNNPNETSINRQLTNEIESGSQILLNTQTRFNSLFNTLVSSQQENATSVNGATDMAFRSDTTQRLLRSSNLRSTSQMSEEISANNEAFDDHAANLTDEPRELNDSQDVVLDLNSNEQNQDGNQQQTAQQQPQSLLKLVLMSLQTNVPIIIILIAKVFHRHLFGELLIETLIFWRICFKKHSFISNQGFLIILAFLATLHWCSRCLVKQIELKVKFHDLRLNHPGFYVFFYGARKKEVGLKCSYC